MYNKLFSKILDSSIWLENTPTRIVWITLLAAMDEDGYAHFSAIANLAARARVTEEEARVAIECFLSPDPNSENPDNEGRRVERVPGGFLILNAAHHRGVLNNAIRREETRKRVSEYRKRLKAKSNDDVTRCNANVTRVTQCNANVRSEGEGEEERERNTNPKAEERLRTISSGSDKQGCKSPARRGVQGGCLAPRKKRADDETGARGTRFLLESIPEEWRSWAQGEGVSDPKAAFDEFHDYWISVPGKKGLKLDWFATFRNSVRNGHDGSPKHGSAKDRYSDGGRLYKPTPHGLSERGEAVVAEAMRRSKLKPIIEAEVVKK